MVSCECFSLISPFYSEFHVDVNCNSRGQVRVSAAADNQLEQDLTEDLHDLLFICVTF